MFVVFTGSWWSLVLRGIAAILFGVLAFMWPGITLTALIFLFGAYALVDGAFAIFAGMRSYGDNKRWWMLLIVGVLSVLAGVIAFAAPGITAWALLILIAARAIVMGAFEIAAAIQLRKYISGEWLLILAGIASVVFGLALLIYPAAGVLALIWLIGIYAIVFGVLLLAFGIKLRGLVHTAEKLTPRPV